MPCEGEMTLRVKSSPKSYFMYAKRTVRICFFSRSMCVSFSTTSSFVFWIWASDSAIFSLHSFKLVSKLWVIPRAGRHLAARFSSFWMPASSRWNVCCS